MRFSSSGEPQKREIDINNECSGKRDQIRFVKQSLVLLWRGKHHDFSSSLTCGKKRLPETQHLEVAAKFKLRAPQVALHDERRRRHSWLGHLSGKIATAFIMETNHTKQVGANGNQTLLSTCFAVALILTFLFNVTSNVLVLLILSRNQRLRTCTNFFIANLCVVDLAAGILLIPASIDSLFIQTEARRTSYKLVCQFFGFVNSFYGVASSLAVAVIALDRYHSILNCLRYETIVTQRRTVFVITWTWLQAIVVSICPILGWGHFSLNPNQLCSRCITDNQGFILLKTVTCVLFPYLITVFCYTRIHIVARRHAKTIVSIKVRDATNKPKGVNLSASKKTIMVYVVLGVYTICWIPLYTLNVLILFYPAAKIPDELLLIATLLTLLNSACNPIMYALITSQFRNGLKRVYRRIRRSIFAGDVRQLNPNGPRGDSRSSWTFTRSSARRIMANQEQNALPRPKLVLDSSRACAIIREESSMIAGFPDKVRDLTTPVYPLTLQVPTQGTYKSKLTIVPAEAKNVKKNGWIEN